MVRPGQGRGFSKEGGWRWQAGWGSGRACWSATWGECSLRTKQQRTCTLHGSLHRSSLPHDVIKTLNSQACLLFLPTDRKAPSDDAKVRCPPRPAALAGAVVAAASTPGVTATVTSSPATSKLPQALQATGALAAAQQQAVANARLLLSTPVQPVGTPEKEVRNRQAGS